MRHISLFLLWLVFWSIPGQAAIFCVDTVSELRSAILDSRNNGQDDEIRIKSGDYLTGPNDPFVVDPQETFDLTISGGWQDFNQIGCLTQTLSPFNTVLDGDGVSRVLGIGLVDNDGNAKVTIRNLSIVNGFGDSVLGAGLRIATDDTFTGTILIDRVFASGNVAPDGSALLITGGNKVTVRNSVFWANETGDGDGVISVSMSADNLGLYFVNNTVIGNHHNNPSPGNFTTSGLYANMNGTGSDGSQSYIANNLFWDNETSDAFTSFTGEHYWYSNNFEDRRGPVSFENGNISLPPRLRAPILDFTPEVDSPLVDVGRQMPPIIPFPTPFSAGWDHGDSDFDGFSRIINRRVDIGALEAPPESPFFEDDFEN